MNNNKIFNNIFKQSHSHKNAAHARVNLIGEHTDNTGGYVLPCLLQYKTVVSVAENKNLRHIMLTLNFIGKKYLLMILLNQKITNGLII